MKLQETNGRIVFAAAMAFFVWSKDWKLNERSNIEATMGQ